MRAQTHWLFMSSKCFLAFFAVFCIYLQLQSLHLVTAKGYFSSQLRFWILRIQPYLSAWKYFIYQTKSNRNYCLKPLWWCRILTRTTLQCWSLRVVEVVVVVQVVHPPVHQVARNFSRLMTDHCRVTMILSPSTLSSWGRGLCLCPWSDVKRSCKSTNFTNTSRWSCTGTELP